MEESSNQTPSNQASNYQESRNQVPSNQAPSYPCGIDEIKQVLPHRSPFLWLSRIISCTPGQEVVAELDVDPGLPLFKGHFPEYPVLPGVIIMEALAQAAGYCLMVEPERQGSLGFFAGIDQAKFRQQVQPGDVLTLKATITKASSRFCAAEVEASVDGAVCATAVQKYMIAAQES